MSDRYEVRVPKEFKVKVRGVDRYGNEFQQTATTLNVSRYGARLNGVGCVANAQTIEVSYGWFHKAKFRVVWAGEPGTLDSAQIGIRSLDPKSNFWDMAFPPPQASPSPTPKNEKESKEKTPAPDSGPIPVTFAFSDSEPMRYESPNSLAMPLDSVPDNWDQPAAPPAVTKGTRTVRSDRRIPVTLRYRLGGANREEEKVMAQVQGDGSCMVEVHDAIPQGTEITVIHGYSNETRPGRVVMSSPSNAGGTHPVAIDLDERDPAFWNATPR